MTDKWMDDRRRYGRTYRKIMLLSHSLTMRGSDVTSLVENTPSGLGGDSVNDRRTDVLTDVYFCVSLRTKYPCV